MFGFHRRRVRRCEWDTLLPKPGPLPQTSHLLDMMNALLSVDLELEQPTQGQLGSLPEGHAPSPNGGGVEGVTLTYAGSDVTAGVPWRRHLPRKVCP
ncbi:hypothetical protein Afil01_47250 [Actinorhabdospora filicis]|uniref:Uncharacterized protein n=1 Tax=Actinorhabdospora filicis TaxID=1785913 RepID=A0A9W6SPU5_9ACTN|nr:hypothetical protein Afil01_47250 [Actinorhabdospora filicis]